MEFLLDLQQDQNNRRQQYRLPETCDFRPHDRYDITDNRHFTSYRGQTIGQYRYYDTTANRNYEYTFDFTRHDDRHPYTTFNRRHNGFTGKHGYTHNDMTSFGQTDRHGSAHSDMTSFRRNDELDRHGYIHNNKGHYNQTKKPNRHGVTYVDREQYRQTDTSDRYDNERHDSRRPDHHHGDERHNSADKDQKDDRYSYRKEKKGGCHRYKKEENCCCHRNRKGEKGGCHRYRKEENVGCHSNRKEGKGGCSGDSRDEKTGRSVTCTSPTPTVVVETEDTTDVIFYPELWATHMTESDYALLYQWEMESDSLNPAVASDVVKASSSLSTISRKRPLAPESTLSMEPPTKQPKVYVNRKHAGFSHMFTHDSVYGNPCYC